MESAQSEADNIISEADGRANRKVKIAKIHADGILSQAEQSAAETKQQAQKYLDGVIQSVEQEKSKPTPKKKKQAEEEIKALRVENVALRQSLDIKNKDAADLFIQLQKAERSDKGKETALRMVSDMLAAYPDEFDKLLQKSRAKKSAAYISEPKSSGNDRGAK